MTKLLDRLTNAISQYDEASAKEIAAEAIQEGIDPLQAIDALVEAIKKIGDGYGRGDLWLPDLIGGGKTMKAAMSVLEDELRKTGRKRVTLGSIVLGTVNGDLHDIGKTMVASLAEAEGFEVIDLGINVEANKFVDAIKKHEPDILALSALMTTTLPEQKYVIETLSEIGTRESVSIAVGGGAVTENFALSIGADGYASTAPKGVVLFKDLLKKRRTK